MQVEIRPLTWNWSGGAGDIYQDLYEKLCTFGIVGSFFNEFGW